jgi:hypothetical protein
MAQGKKTGGGSRKGSPNKATADVRAAIALLLEGNVGKFQAWLTAVAEGEKEPATKRDGEPILDANGDPVYRWLRPPDPGYAMRLAMDVAEYHIPKLARTEINGEIGIRGRLIISD